MFLTYLIPYCLALLFVFLVFVCLCMWGFRYTNEFWTFLDEVISKITVKNPDSTEYLVIAQHITSHYNKQGYMWETGSSFKESLKILLH